MRRVRANNPDSQVGGLGARDAAEQGREAKVSDRMAKHVKAYSRNCAYAAQAATPRIPCHASNWMV
jgi:hypothetical protein